MRALFIAAFTLLAITASVSAAPSAAQRRAARALHDQALRNYEVGSFRAALDGFTRAYELVGEPVLLYNAAQCEKHLGRPQQAMFLFRRYLEAAPKASNRADVERRIAELEA